jgi:hypothetical protein
MTTRFPTVPPKLHNCLDRLNSPVDEGEVKVVARWTRQGRGPTTARGIVLHDINCKKVLR